MEEIKVEKGVPMPSSASMTGKIRSLKIGDSFVVPRYKAPSMWGLAKRAGIKIAQRSISETEARIWRIK